MSKLAFVFSGQGSQYSGMGAELYEGNLCVQEVYDIGSQILGYDLHKATQSGEDKLCKTGLAQPLIYTMSMAGFALLKERGVVPQGVAGFSLGECSAVTAAGGLSLEDGFALIKARAMFMEQAANEGGGAMSAILSLEDSVILEVCEKIDGYVIPVNFNCNGQTVIAGEVKAVAQAEEALLLAGASKVVRLAVSGAFHSKMMEKAAERLVESLVGTVSHQLSIPLFSGVTGEKTTYISDIPGYFGVQMISPVRWKQCVGTMMEDGIDTFIELGPKKTLCSFIRKIERSNKVFNLEDNKTLDKLLEAMKE